MMKSIEKVVSFTPEPLLRVVDPGITVQISSDGASLMLPLCYCTEITAKIVLPGGSDVRNDRYVYSRGSGLPARWMAPKAPPSGWDKTVQKYYIL